jgi:hypothetical protein
MLPRGGIPRMKMRAAIPAKAFGDERDAVRMKIPAQARYPACRRERLT